MANVSRTSGSIEPRRRPAPVDGPSPRRLAALIVSALVLLAIAGAAVWLIVDSGGGSKTPAQTVSVTPIKPVALSVSGLKTLTATLNQVHGQPIYWAGAKAGFLYELRRTTNGNVYIRYLPRNVNAGAPAPRYLTVATYPFTDAYGALQKVAGSNAVNIPGGGIAFVDAKDPKSIHLAYPNINYQVEVYDPSPAKALSVASSGLVRPVR
jgi:hypothetical protein